MRVNMVGICMHREQHLVPLAVNEMLRKILRDLKGRFVIDIIQRVKRDRHFVRKNSIRLVLRVAFPVQLARDQYSVCKVLTVAAHGSIKPLGGLFHTAFDLLLFLPEHIVRRSFQRPDRFAGRIINIDVPERH